MFSFNPLKSKSVIVLSQPTCDMRIEKEEMVDPDVGIPEVVIKKKRLPKPGMRLVKEYRKSKANIDDSIENIIADLVL